MGASTVQEGASTVQEDVGSPPHDNRAAPPVLDVRESEDDPQGDLKHQFSQVTTAEFQAEAERDIRQLLALRWIN